MGKKCPSRISPSVITSKKEVPGLLGRGGRDVPCYFSVVLVCCMYHCFLSAVCVAIHSVLCVVCVCVCVENLFLDCSSCCLCSSLVVIVYGQFHGLLGKWH